MMDYWSGFEYKLDGKLHRTNGPALDLSDMSKFRGRWWLFGKRHRYYGPTNTKSTHMWWIHGDMVK